MLNQHPEMVHAAIVGSPLGRLQLGLGILEKHLPPSAAPTFNEVYEEAQVMNELINELLAFSRAGVGGSRLPSLTTSLKDLVLEAVQREDARDRVRLREGRQLGRISIFVRI